VVADFDNEMVIPARPEKQEVLDFERSERAQALKYTHRLFLFLIPVSYLAFFGEAWQAQFTVTFAQQF